MRKRGIAKWQAPLVGGTVVPVFPQTDRERIDEIHRRSLRKLDWRPKASNAVLVNYIGKYGWDAFRAKVCEERRSRREVLHAKGVAGSPVSKPEFSVKSLVRC